MKKFIQLAFVCLSIGVISASTSCSSNYDAAPEVPGKDTIRNPMQGDFTAVVNGINFIADTKGYQDATVGGIRVLTVYGIMNSPKKDPKYNTSINLNINNYNGPGVYTIQPGILGTYIVLDNGTPKAYISKAGDSASYIQIVTDGEKIEGKFNFIGAPDGLGGADNQSIADGNFSIPK
jgi:hypothetical protein